MSTTFTDDNNAETTERDQRLLKPRWLYLYFVLALCMLTTLAASRYFNYLILQRQQAMLDFHRQWTDRGRQYDELAQLAGDINRPGNDVFQSSQPSEEARRLEVAVTGFDRALAAAVVNLRSNVSDERATTLRRMLEDVNAHVNQMAIEAKAVLSAFSTNREQAGERMAAMDRENQAALSAIQALQLYVGTVQEEFLREQDAETAAISEWGLLMNGIVVAIVIAVVLYAVVLSKRSIASTRAINGALEALRESEAKLRLQTDAAEDANRAKSAFLANMSHEIRTPMTAIIGFSDVLVESQELDNEGREAATIIRRSAKHLLSVINDVLDVSKIEANRMTIERTTTDVRQIAVDVASLMRPSAIEKQVQLRLTFGDQLPRSIQCDPLRLKQVLMNIVGNSVKFTQRGEVSLHLAMEVVAGKCMMICEIRDTGIGMSAEQLQHICEPFRQADESTTRRFGGTGLGLTISNRLVQLLAGEMKIESVEGLGTKVRISLPAGDADQLEMVHGGAESLLQGATHRQDCSKVALHGTILLAEDGVDNQRLISNHLRKAGASVVIAENGRIAVELACSQSFDLILMDMQMPEMDGYTATQELRRRGCDLPIIALTAHAMNEDREKCLAAGCSGYLSKPIPKHELLAAIAEALGIAGGVKTEHDEFATSATDAEALTKPLRSEYADDPDMKDAIREFVQSMPRTIEMVREQIDRSDRVALRRTLHQLKGAGGGYGFSSLSNWARETEEAFEDGASKAELNERCGELEALAQTLDYCEVSHG